MQAVSEGLGYRVLNEREFEFLFEVAGLAEDDEHGPALCGYKIKVSTEGSGKVADGAMFERAAQAIAERGIPDLGIKPNQLRPITAEQYKAEGYDDE